MSIFKGFLIFAGGVFAGFMIAALLTVCRDNDPEEWG